jgi:hypothetical protein
MGYPSITGVQYLNSRSPKQTVTMFNTRHIKKKRETNTQNTRNKNNKSSLMFQKENHTAVPNKPNNNNNSKVNVRRNLSRIACDHGSLTLTGWTAEYPKRNFENLSSKQNFSTPFSARR